MDGWLGGWEEGFFFSFSLATPFSLSLSLNFLVAFLFNYNPAFVKETASN
jgi:hypothetical protein